MITKEGEYSRSEGQAHSRKRINMIRSLITAFKDWLFNDAKGSDFDWKEGGVVIKCAVHDD